MTEIYQVDDLQGSSRDKLNIETPSKLLIWQFRIQSYAQYKFVTAGYFIEIGKLMQVVKFIEKCDYITYKGKIVNYDMDR
jgi:hypothetical protein